MSNELGNVLRELSAEANRLADLIQAGRIPPLLAARAAVAADGALATLRPLRPAEDAPGVAGRPAG